MVADRTQKRSSLPVLITVLTVVAAVAVGIRMTGPEGAGSAAAGAADHLY